MTPLSLPMLEPHRAALETCVYCPKLSRAACPVSNAEHSETVTPWGKMSLAYFAARGDVPVDAVHAAPAWACTSCYACRERCDHRNEVAAALTDTRAEMFARGAAPEAAVKVSARFQARGEETARALDAIEATLGGPAPGAAPVLVGCGYARRAPDVVEDALYASSTLLGGPVRAVRPCCGLPLLHAGDRPGFVEAARRFASAVEGAAEVVVVDPGCARTLLVEYPRAGVAVPRVDLFVDLAARDRGLTAVVEPEDPPRPASAGTTPASSAAASVATTSRAPSSRASPGVLRSSSSARAATPSAAARGACSR